MQKDHLEHDNNKHVVYRLECSNCKTTYVRQTKYKLKMHIGEHRNQINRNNDNFLVVTEHRMTIGHDLEWISTKILDYKKSYFKRVCV